MSLSWLGLIGVFLFLFGIGMLARALMKRQDLPVLFVVQTIAGLFLFFFSWRIPPVGQLLGLIIFIAYMFFVIKRISSK